MKNDTKITNASVESAGLPKDYKQVLAEYIWNAFDAKATIVDLQYSHNELGFIERLTISDNGEGIAYPTLGYSFGNFLDSQKRVVSKRTSYTRGRKGKGRFSFTLFASRATWKTVFHDTENELLKTYNISIDRFSKESYDVSESRVTDAQSTGTVVFLEGIFDLSASQVDSKEFHDFLASEFGWFLFLNKENNYQIKINSVILSYDQIIQESDNVSWTLQSPEENSYVFHVQYVRWNKNIGDRYYYYLLNTDKMEVAKLLTSFNNNAIDFHHSVYVRSAFFNHFDQADISNSEETNLFGEREQHVVFRKLQNELRDFLERKQKKYIRENAVRQKISELLDKKLLPPYALTPEAQKRKNILITLIQELYISDPRVFIGVKPDFIRTYLGFLDLLLQSERKSDIFPIIDSVLSLSDKERARILQLIHD